MGKTRNCSTKSTGIEIAKKAKYAQFDVMLYCTAEYMYTRVIRASKITDTFREPKRKFMVKDAAPMNSSNWIRFWKEAKLVNTKSYWVGRTVKKWVNMTQPSVNLHR